MSDDVAWTKQLLASGVKWNQKDAFGCNSLHLAARKGNLDLVIAIVLDGADINSKGACGWYVAVSVSNLQIVHYLLYKRADTLIQNDLNETPREFAVRRGFDAATIDTFFVQIGDEAMFKARELAIQNAESIKYPLSLVSTPNSKNKGEKGKSGFGSLFGGGSSSKSSNAASSASLTVPAKRNIFGRTSNTVPPSVSKS
ncbi:hypothetical protein HDU91_001986 [Kappamyces sp. JEL0680]|nr:hypothetical protein HDU91_001986 [Kappamyces sp. JEL0680]